MSNEPFVAGAGALTPALVGILMHINVQLVAVAVGFQLMAYLRPGKLMMLKRKNLIPPFSQANSRHWPILILRLEDGKSSKVGEFEESMVLDGSQHVWINRWLSILHRHLGAE